MKFYFGEYVRDNTVPWVRRRPPAEAIWTFDWSNLTNCASSAARSGMGLFVTPDDVNLPTDYQLLHQGHWNDAPRESVRAGFKRLTGSSVADGDSFIDWMVSAMLFGSDPSGIDKFRPIMPSARIWTIHLPNNEIWQRPLDLNTPEGNVFIQMKRAEYEEIRTAARAGEIVGPNGVDEEAHRRWLSKLGTDVGVFDPEDIFIPDHLPREGKLPHRTSYSESFNKADSSTLGPDLTWTKVAGSGAQVVSNQCDMITTSGFDECRVRAEHDTSSSDTYTQMTVKAIGWFAVIQTAVRYQPAADTFYALGYSNPADTHSWECYKWVAGVETGPLNGQDTTAISVDDVMRGEISGSSLTLKQNSTTRNTATDSAIASGTRGGFRLGEDAGAATIDVFSFGDLVENPSRVLMLLGVG